ncbi:uncharacterized protein MELLADRAFT_92992 [Melampsora larici-populina 98AG31]|uniref:CxC1-like cysteine cluster associated with KDZ transposases domain-containing protein n=1 Tax=Melampsora larici-populina (strain 98AG31 / pathotype 3-4-7) TaxID=747676 RepID=F4S3I2_MELLP|nr:uncharacterized protein MELLADRAFT_92992 [Melampsora larici-populina 98AG31]EGG00817.1 hypothetical protein MELLADRAFT_92992 [Melampsora larici-populina 98AG31]
MPKNGTDVPCPRGTQSKKKRTKLTPSEQRLAAFEAPEASWAKKSFSQLAIERTKPPGPAETAPGRPPDGEGDRDGPFPGLEMWLPDREPIHPPSTPPPSNFKEYLAMPSYKRKRIREERQWQHITKVMLPEYLKCSQMTSQWGNLSKWNHDWHPTCSNPARCTSRPPREVDMVDIAMREKQKIQFCDCQSDQVRLLQMGYIGGTPVHPVTAYSVRLLRSYHTLWKQSSVPISKYANYLDEFLDAFSPRIVVKGTDKPRQWRRTLSCAVDAYRELNRLQDELIERALQLNSLDNLAGNCPRCFGPLPASDRLVGCEADYHVCLDANFQQRRHESASDEYEELGAILTDLFLPQKRVDEWADKLDRSPHPAEAELDCCTTQHKAANDQHTGKTWRAAAETGVMGMGCRHDNLLSLISINTGERAYYAMALIDWLLEQIAEAVQGQDYKRNEIFEAARAHGQLQFATSLFHSYVHQWSCQLKYNPRLNMGWGLTDGEGMERDWSDYSDLVACLRYVTQAHRIRALTIRGHHLNERKRLNSAAISSHNCLTISEQLRIISVCKISTLELQGKGQQYLAEQWDRQRHCQLEAMSNDNRALLKSELETLLDLEERFINAHKKLKLLQAKNRRSRTEAEQESLRRLPDTLVLFEEQIELSMQRLGSGDFHEEVGITDPQGRGLIRIQLAKMKLLEAKAGIVEVQNEWDQRGLGCRKHERYRTLMKGKQDQFQKKYKTFETQINDYSWLVFH